MGISFNFLKVKTVSSGNYWYLSFYHETRYKLIHKLILSLIPTLILTVPFILTLIDADCTTHPPFSNYPLNFRKLRTNICKKVPQSEDQSSKQSEDQYL
jgi:hypothetical protein